jgi:hypothetical protein
MASARHKGAAPSAPRRDPRRLSALVVLAAVAGLGAVAGPVAGAEPPRVDRATLDLTATTAGVVSARSSTRREAPARVSRDQVRQPVVRAAVDAPAPLVGAPQAVPASTPGFTQDDTKVVADPRSGARVLDDLERGVQVALTGRTARGFAEVVRDGALAWVAADDVDDTPPPKETAPPPVQADAPAGAVPAQVSDSPCPGGGSVESGLTSSTVRTYRAVCAAFPGLSYGGVRPGDPGEHGAGRALDIMVGTATGNQVAAYLQQNASRLGVDNVIWRQRIWFAGDPSSQWQTMEDRGSATANHMDHVHVGTR